MGETTFLSTYDMNSVDITIMVIGELVFCFLFLNIQFNSEMPVFKFST